MSARFQNTKERDLFEQGQAADKKVRKKAKFLLGHAKNSIAITYENIIFVAIGFIMSCIIFFSLGVEKGRQEVGRLSIRDRKEMLETKVEKKEERPEIVERRMQSGYVVQVAAFRKQDSAVKELMGLRKEGYNADIKKAGDYYQLYIGSFDKRREAERLYEKLKTKYKDSYIKKL